MKDKEEFISQVAAEYAVAKHEPNHPGYAAFCRETVAQFTGLINSGWKFTRTPDESYANSEDMFRDMRLNKHLRVFTGGQLAPYNPLNWTVWEFGYPYISSSVPYPNPWSVNEAFRAAHDILGHGKDSSPHETFEGELAAYQEHKKWYSPEALPALYSETVGQLCVYYSTGDFVGVQENKIIEVRL